MLAINLLPWRDDARIRQKKIFKIIIILTFIISCVVYVLIYQQYKMELRTINKRISISTHKLEKFTHKSTHSLSELHKIVNKTQRHQDQLKKLLHTMFVHSNIVWNSLEIQNGVIKIYGRVDLMAYLSSFVNDAKQFNFIIVIKSLKILSPFSAVQFQLQMTSMSAT